MNWSVEEEENVEKEEEEKWCGGGGVRVSAKQRDSQAGRQEAASSDSGLVYVTLTENRTAHVGVSGDPDTSSSLHQQYLL